MRKVIALLRATGTERGSVSLLVKPVGTPHMRQRKSFRTCCGNNSRLILLGMKTVKLYSRIPVHWTQTGKFPTARERMPLTAAWKQPSWRSSCSCCRQRRCKGKCCQTGPMYRLPFPSSHAKRTQTSASSTIKKVFVSGNAGWPLAATDWRQDSTATRKLRQ